MEFPKGNNKRLLKNEKNENNSSKKLKFDIKEKEDFTAEKSSAEKVEKLKTIQCNFQLSKLLVTFYKLCSKNDLQIYLISTFIESNKNCQRLFLPIINLLNAHSH